ncbi:MAG TPA: DUF2530 domain-containing protein [Streptosporangiaceae bacterium]
MSGASHPEPPSGPATSGLGPEAADPGQTEAADPGQTEAASGRRVSPPPLEANDRLVTAVVTAGWAVALIVLLAVRTEIPSRERWWIWVAVAGLIMGLFALWYVPHLQRSRARTAGRRAARNTDGAP